ncbi:MAG TPA: hypothetical protein VF084_01200 [Nitrososphaeraceae archaeon]
MISFKLLFNNLKLTTTLISPVPICTMNPFFIPRKDDMYTRQAPKIRV